MSVIRTHSGKDIDVFDANPDDIVIEDIAHALSRKCRFGGHVKDFYSVADHCTRVATYLWRKYPDRDELALWGLLHDAAEAYLCDMPAPVKRQMPEFKKIENRLLEVIVVKFGLSWPEPPEVKEADMALLATEARDCLPSVWPDWDVYWKPLALDETVEPMSMDKAKYQFLRQYAFHAIQFDGGEAFNERILNVIVKPEERKSNPV